MPTIDEIDERARWESDARDERGPLDAPFYAEWKISGTHTREEWSEIEGILDEHGLLAVVLQEAV